MNARMSSEAQQNKLRARLTGGAILIFVGLVLLLQQFVSDRLAMFFPLGLGLAFLAWGMLGRIGGLLVPGGIMSGLGTGLVLITGPLAGLPEMMIGAVILLSLAAGFASIVPLSWLAIGHAHPWPLIPAAVMAFFGGSLLAGDTGLQILLWFGRGWPLILITIGLYLILWRKGLQR